MKKILAKNSGQLLVETLIALAVISMALVASLSVTIRAMRVSRNARNRLEATKGAENMLEQIRHNKEQDPENFFRNAVCLDCLSFGVNNMYSCNVTCNFTSDTATVRVTVTWNDAGVDTSISLDTELTKAKL